MQLDYKNLDEKFIDELQKKIIKVEDNIEELLEIKDKIIGYICGWKFIDEFNITNIAITKDFQRKAFAKDLVQFLMSKLLGEKCFKFFLEVRESNNAAKKLYKKMGFSVIGSRKKYYHSPEEDALVLGVNLMNNLKKG